MKTRGNKTASDINRICRRYFDKSFAALVANPLAPEMYLSRGRTAQLKRLADYYDQRMIERGDARRVRFRGDSDD